MEINLPQLRRNRQEVQCSDCGHHYAVMSGLRSARCPECGNIEYLAVLPPLVSTDEAPATPPRQFPTMLEAIDTSFGRIAEQKINPLEVETILREYPTEWQLWAAVTQHFGSALYHVAYLSLCARKMELAKASERYLEHQKVFQSLRNETWQVDYAEEMLGRIQQMMLMQWEMFEEASKTPRFLDFGPYQEDRAAWIFVWLSAGVALALALAFKFS